MGAIVALQEVGDEDIARIDWHDLAAWLADVPPENAIVALVRVVTLALAWWLAASTVLYAIARVTRVPAAAHGASWITVPTVRRLVDGVVASTVVASATLTSPAVAAASSSLAPVRTAAWSAPADDGAPVGHGYTPTPAGDGTATTETTATYTPRPAGIGEQSTTSTTAPAMPPARTSAGPPQPVSSSPLTHRVAPGDNLWTIAVNRVALASGIAPDDVSDGDARAYWLRLLDANRAHLRSGDPNLIFPGETLELPGSLTSTP